MLEVIDLTVAYGPVVALNGVSLTVADASMMAVLANADCLLVREPFAPAAPAGSRGSILRLTRPF